ncbi:hypothetical protein FACS1894110_15900 [Spirochaetia bacterium]|nr:hypothetical protein FACS1894110_15900 [Spirochaetia bacterium]
MAEHYKVRALEVDDTFQMWSPYKMQRVFEFMIRNNMNTLVFHENNIVDKIVWPGFIYGYEKDDLRSYSIYREKLYKEIYYRTPSPYVFIDELMIFRDLMKTILGQAKELGLDIYLQPKEIWFPELLYERQDLMKNGKMCPSEPWWWETFLPKKYEELLQNFPEITGIVTSTGTKESRISLAHQKCQCDKCKAMKMEDWQHKVIMSIYTPLKAHGKKLVIRDFSYYADEQNGIRAGLLNLPDDIIISIKNVPQDYYQTFPHNKLIGHVGKHEQWIEYETMGEYYGWGLAPVSMLNDIQYRMKYCLENGADGISTRIDWEALPNHSTFETPNQLNLYAIAQLGLNVDLPLQDIYCKWLVEDHLLKEGINPNEFKDCLDFVKGIFEKTWPVMSKTPHLLGAVFMNNSKIPVSIDNADFISQEHHGIHKWFPEYKELFNYDDKHAQGMLNEKEEAYREIIELNKQWHSRNPGLKDEVYHTYCGLFDIFELFVKMFRLVGKSYVYIKYLQLHGKNPTLMSREGLIGEIKKLIGEMKTVEQELKDHKAPVQFKYQFLAMMNPERLRVYYEDVEAVLATLI